MTKNDAPVIVWFRQDLRLKDNPALLAAHKTKQPILPLYILDDINSGQWMMGGASRWWLHHSLIDLNTCLENKLVFAKGDPLDILKNIIQTTGASAIFWNRCYEPWRIQRDTLIKKNFKKSCIEVKSFNSALVFEPQEVLKKDNTPYRVFTPFFKAGYLAKGRQPRDPLPKPRNLNLFAYKILDQTQLQLLPTIPWYKSFKPTWTPGEKGAQQQFKYFIKHSLTGYKEGRNFPEKDNVSRLSPHIHFGEISPHQLWYDVKKTLSMKQCPAEDAQHFLSEIGWREFSYSLLFHYPNLPLENLQKKFDAFSWQKNTKALKSWQKGETGYPIVDAGMRELWQTGYMHNRVRMIVGSFLVKNLRIHWHHGESWFWDTLLDADLANNAASWQWIAGCGADAAPYFRIFNPVTQGQKFDPTGEYVRRFVPELKHLPIKYLFSPWEAPENILNQANIKLGKDYPKPIVDLKASRHSALAEYSRISG